MDRYYGTVIGLVNDLDDPEGLGRVRLRFPWLAEETDSGWARMLRPMAGKDRGFYYMPEQGDEVLVAFEHGDPRVPYVLGALYSRVDDPPDADIDIHVRRIKTVSGHILDFDDRDGKERIELKTQGGHKLAMEDSPGTVTLETSGGQKLLMEDNPAKITLSTTGGTKLELNDVPGSVLLSTPTGTTVEITASGGVSVSAPAGMLDITCLSATVNATASCTVNSASISFNSGIAMFSGVVQCSALITQAVVSQAYTPGAGNIW